MSDQSLLLLGHVVTPPWLPPAGEWTTGLPAEVVTVSDCLADLLRTDSDEIWLGPDQRVDDARLGSRRISAGVTSVALSQLSESFREEPPDSRFLQEAMVERRAPVATDPLLGYEVIGYEWGNFHSWLCNSLQRDLPDIELNDHGLIRSFAEAERVAAFANEDDGTEPVDWIVAELREVRAT